ncbi:hypothetical protein QP228_009770 [Pseudoglutamicibacter cumminsii]|uniref:hypothetical protein n=1 Tax=Pseudoglutamicibacter cumminsii TaxID=156979 RepID=UPI002ABA3375|nr:hypothetical protein [Pseudoglutamicibacter cumminsii]MDZ3746250.1 hypothetical protein [Pseudoglutamicibacter cumminsii]
MADSQCEWWQFTCKAGEAIKDLADSVISGFVQSLLEGAVTFVAQVSTFWMDTPSPDVNNAAVASLRDDLSWYVAGFAILGFLVGLIKLVMSQDVKNSLIGLATPIVNMILAATAYGAGIGLLLTASDEFSKWIVERSTGGDVDLTQMLTTSAVLVTSLGTAFLLFILLFLGAIMNLLFMYFRDVMFLILAAFIVVLAAASGSEQGRQAWRKANGWLIALLLYKPVAAGIYSLGFRILVSGSAPEGEEATVPEAMHSTLIALLILLLAALALPALVKFIVPAAGVGAGAFSGGAALGAGVTIAAGAAVLAGAGGATAAAGGAGAAMGGGAGAVGGGSGAAAAAGGGTTAGGGGSTGGTTAGGGGSTGGSAGASVSGSSGGGSDGGTTAGGGGSTGGTTAGGGGSTGGSAGASVSGSSGGGSDGAASSSSSSSNPTGAGASTSPGSSGSGSSGSSGTGANSPSSAQNSTPPAGGPSGAKAPNKLNEAMQKMSDVKGIAKGAKPSKLVDEDGE